MKRINHILMAAMVLVMVVMFANANIPPAPVDPSSDTGNYWVNYTWSEDLDHPDNDNVTDSFNVSMNGMWYNGTATFLNKSVGPGGWANIIVWAYNRTGNGNMSVDNVNDNVQAPSIVIPTGLTCGCGDICVNTSSWWRGGGVLNGSGTPIQAAVDAAEEGETICVAAGSYEENVDIETSHLTLRGEGADVVNVRAASISDYVFEVTADYVNISGFNVTGATGSGKAGIHLNGGQHCNISDNNASGNRYGIYLSSSSNNTLTGNNASDNGCGIVLVYSSNDNTLTSNTASDNNYCGIMLGAGVDMAEGVSNKTASNNFGRMSPISSNNTLADNDASDKGYGIMLGAGVEMVEGASNNTLTNNTVNSNTNYGIYLSSSSNNNTLTSNNASGNLCGIWLGAGIMAPDSASNNTTSNNFGRRSPISSNDASGKSYGIGLGAGVELAEGANNNTLTGNDASNNWIGIVLVYSSNNTLSSNTASGNLCGIWLEYSSNNTLSSNTMSGNDYNFGVDGNSLSDYTQTIYTNNTVDGKPIYYWVDQQGGQIPTNAGYVGVVNSTNIIVQDLNLAKNLQGILFVNTSNSTIENVTTSDNYYGICLHYSSNNMLANNTASDNSDRDIRIVGSPSNTFADNTLNGTTVSFTYSGDISLKGEGSPAANPSGWHNISKFISATNQSAGAWLYLNFSYSDSDLTDTMVESSLTVWKHNGTGWAKDGWDNGRYLDTTGDVVGVNITTFSVFAPMGVPPLHYINVTPGLPQTLGINESQDFIAKGYDQDGAEIPDYFVFEWGISDVYIGNLTGLNDTATNFTADHVGITYITASNGSVTSGQVQVTVDAAEPTNETVTNGAAIVTSGDANVTCDFGDDVTGWINITAIGNATNSSEVNSSKPRYGLGSGDKAVSGVTVNVSKNILAAMANGSTIRIQICYNVTTLAALGIDASTLAIWKYNSTSDTWEKQPSTRSGTCVYVDVDHLCTFGLVGSKAALTPSGGSSGGSGTYPPGWFGTPEPAVTATKAPAAPATATAAPPGDMVTPASTKAKPAAAKPTTPAAEGATAGTAKKGAPGFTAVFVIAEMLAVAYAMMRRRE